MAGGEGEGHDPMRDVYFFIAFLVIVVIFWYAGGGPGRASLNGIFLAAPPEAGGSGQSYGPQFPTDSVAAPGQVQAPASASSPVQGPPCGYVSNSSPREVTANFSYGSDPNNDEDICINACKQARNAVYGTQDSGTCFFVSQDGVQYTSTIDPD